MMNVKVGFFYGMFFCFISAIFDVYVSHITQSLNSFVFIIYCFSLSSIFFITVSVIKTGGARYFYKAKEGRNDIFLVNLAVLLNWGGLILSLRYLEPAVVGISSVAFGPALTLVISQYIIKNKISYSKVEGYISWLVLVSVIVMLINSYTGNSGVILTSYKERIIGITSVILSAIGTVLYTFWSKRLSISKWQSYEILGVRNFLMLAVAFAYIFFNNISLAMHSDVLIIIFFLSFFGHIIPVFLIQKTISSLDPIHVSLILLLLPVFTLFFQFIDERIIVSYESIFVVFVIAILLAFLGITKIKEGRK